MNTYRIRMPKRRKHLSANMFGAAAIVLAVGGLAQPAISQAAWDIGKYDHCMRVNNDAQGCCAWSDGEWDEKAGKCVAPLTAQTPPQSPGELHQVPGTGTNAQTEPAPQTPGETGQTPGTYTQGRPAQAPVVHPWLP